MSENQQELLGLGDFFFSPNVSGQGSECFWTRLKAVYVGFAKNTCGFCLDLVWAFKHLFYYFLSHTHMCFVHNKGFIFLINEYKHVIFTKHASSVQ